MANGWPIAVLVDNDSWILPYAERLVADWRAEGHEAVLCRRHEDIPAGELAFLLGCVRLVPSPTLHRNKHNLVVHESDLPRGRGFAPLASQILEGRERIPIVLFEAVEDADAGPIYLMDEIVVGAHTLMPEIRRIQGEATIALCKRFVAGYPRLVPTPQEGEPSYYRRRTPEDSRLDPDRTLRGQFRLLRVVDNDRYPAFFEIDGHRYVLRIERAGEEGGAA